MAEVRRPAHVGLTGNIGSGKSTVAKLLVAKGAVLIDSDALAREATSDPAILKKIADALGGELVKNGALDRAKTAERVFADKAALTKLNSIIHPWVREQSEARAKRLAESAKPPPIILFDIPLLYENGLEENVDAVIVVEAPLALRIERVKERSGLSEADIHARDAAQLDLTEKVKRADHVVSNRADLASLEQQVNDLWPKLLTPAA